VVTFPAAAGIGPPAVHGKTVKLLVSCQGDAGGRCAVTIKLRKGNAVLGSKALTLTAGKSKTVTVSLNPAGKRRLKHQHPLTLTLLVAQSGQPVSSRSISFR
jgi:hypothetical protein